MTSCGAELIGARLVLRLSASVLPFAATALLSSALLAAAFFAFLADDFLAGFFAVVAVRSSSAEAPSASASLYTLSLRPRAGFLASTFAAPSTSDPFLSDDFDGFFVAFLRVVLRGDLLSSATSLLVTLVA